VRSTIQRRLYRRIAAIILRRPTNTVLFMRADQLDFPAAAAACAADCYRELCQQSRAQASVAVDPQIGVIPVDCPFLLTISLKVSLETLVTLRNKCRFSSGLSPDGTKTDVCLKRRSFLRNNAQN